MIAALVLTLAGCAPTQGSAPPRISGTWEVAGHAPAGACRWARATWTFGEATVTAALDVLCGDAGAEYAGCTVQVESPAGFDASTGRWQVDRPVEARADAAATGDDHELVPSTCAVALPEGMYGFTKVRGAEWKWTMATPTGEELRLKVPDATHPDFVTALTLDPPEARLAQAAPETTSIWGSYRIADVVEDGKTEDYRKKMERTAKALQRRCTVTDTTYDLRSPSGALPPTVLALTEVRTCDEGGLGHFRHALTATVPIEWVDNEGGAMLVVPPLTSDAGIVRIHAEEGSGRPPSQWMSNDLGLTRDQATFLVAVTPPKGKKPGPPPAVQLKAVDGTVFHLVPAS